MNALISNFVNLRIQYHRFLYVLTNRNFPTPELCPAFEIGIPPAEKSGSSLLKDIIGDGFLLAAVPKARRSIERRLTRKHAWFKLIVPKKNLVTCDVCGHFHPVHAVCGNCYEKVKAETEVMQEAIFKELKLDPIEEEVVVLYQNDPKNNVNHQGKRIVEIDRERPQWFSKNLLAKDSETYREPAENVGLHQPQATIKD